MKTPFLLILCSLLFACTKNKDESNFNLSEISPVAGGECQYVQLKADFSQLDTNDILVNFNGVEAEVATITDSSLLVKVPAGATTGKISVESAGNTYTSLTDFNVLKGTWKRLPDFPGEARFGGVGFVIEDKIYYGTGSNNGTYFDNFWEYDPVSEQWTQKADFPGGACYGSTGVTVGTKGYVGFGAGNGYKNFLWSYEPETDTWTRLADCPSEGDYGMAGFELNGKAYFGGGVESANFWEYDPATDAWTQLPNSPPGNQRFAGIGFSHNGKGYTGLGGYEGDKKLYSFDPVNGQWTTTTEIPTNQSVLFFSSSFMINEKVFVRIKDECWSFSTTNNSWEQIAAPCGSPQYAENAFSVGGKGYLICGNGGSDIGAWPGLTIGATKEVWEFTPTD
jgi:N-acetylneuraminic acid mutarotase